MREFLNDPEAFEMGAELEVLNNIVEEEFHPSDRPPTQDRCVLTSWN